jgi:hypothetical protein
VLLLRTHKLYMLRNSMCLLLTAHQLCVLCISMLLLRTHQVCVLRNSMCLLLQTICVPHNSVFLLLRTHLCVPHNSMCLLLWTYHLSSAQHHMPVAEDMPFLCTTQQHMLAAEDTPFSNKVTTAKSLRKPHEMLH